VYGTALLKEPITCTEAELDAFARLVRRGFERAADLGRRIRSAKWLAFHYGAVEALTAVAALKVPDVQIREGIFAKADAPVSSDGFTIDLGWIFVTPAHRGHGIATDLCRKLVSRVPASGVFATTRASNDTMIHILLALDFARVGTPFRRGSEELVLFLRPPTAGTAPDPATPKTLI
jgi:GNAT superfamily N-acetyltransferase